MTLKQLLEKAGVTNAEFATIMGCSEIAVMKWKVGGGVHRLRVEKFDAVCIAISESIHCGKLPLPKRRRGEPARTEKIKSLLVRYLPNNVKI